MTAQRQELEVALNFSSNNVADKVLETLERIKGVRDDLAGKALLPLVDSNTREAIAKILADSQKLKNELPQAKDSEGVSKLAAELQRVAASLAAVKGATDNYAQALQTEQASLIQVEAAIKKVSATKGEADNAIKVLIKSQKTETVEFAAAIEATVQLSQKLNELKSQKKQLTDVTALSSKANKAEEGSADQLRAKLSILTKEYDGLSKAKRNSSEGKELKKSIGEVTEELGKLEQGTGRFQRNVGNYQSAFNDFLSKIPGGGKVKEIVEGLKKVGETVEGVGAAAEEGAAGTGILSGSLGGLLAVGGVVVGGLALMATSFFRTTEGAKDLNIAVGTLEGTFSGLLSAFNPFGDHFGEFVTQAVKGAEAGAELARVENEQLEAITKLTKAYGEYNAQLIINQQLASDTGRDFAQREESLNKAISERIALNITEQGQIKTKLNLVIAESKNAQATDKDRRTAQLEATKLEAEFLAKQAEGIAIGREGQIQLFDLKKETIESSYKLEEVNNQALLKNALQISQAEIYGEEVRTKAAKEANRLAEKDAKDRIARANDQLTIAQKSAEISGANDLLASKRFVDAQAEKDAAVLNLQNVQEANAQRLEEIQLRFFRNDITRITQLVSVDKEALDNTANNEKKSYEERFAAISTFQKRLRDATQDEQKAFEERTGRKVNFNDLINTNDPHEQERKIKELGLPARAEKTITSAIDELKKYFQQSAQLIEKNTQAQFDANEKIIKQTEELAAKNVIAYRRGEISAEQFSRERLDLENQQSIAIEDIRFKLVKDAADKQAKILLNEKEFKALSEELETEHKDKLHQIDVDKEKKGSTHAQAEITLEQAKNQEIATETIHNKERLAEQIEKIDRNALLLKIRNEQDEIEALKKLGEDTLALETQLANDKKKLAEDTEKEKRRFLDETLEKTKENVNVVGGAIEAGFNRNADFLNDKISHQGQDIQNQALLASKGLDNTLAQSQAREVQLEKEQESLRRKAAVAAKLQAFFTMLAEFSKTNPDTAAAKAIAAIAITDIVVSKFEEGSVGTIGSTLQRNGKGGGVRRNGMIFGRRHSAGGVLLEAEQNEAILNRKAVSLIGENTIAEINRGNIPSELTSSGLLSDTYFAKESARIDSAIQASNILAVRNDSNAVLSEIKGMREDIQNKPETKFEVDNFGNMIKEVATKHLIKRTIYKYGKRIGQ